MESDRYPAPGPNIREATDLFDQLFLPLIRDVNEQRKRLSADGERGRRALVRSVFAFVEGMTHAMKQLCLHWSNVDFSPAEQALLREEWYSLKDNGIPMTKSAHLRMGQNTRFTFSMLAKAFGNAPHAVEWDGEGWSSLKSAVGVRNRLMHPRGAKDLEVTDDEIEAAMSGFRWFASNLLSLILAGGIALLKSPDHIQHPKTAERLQKFEEQLRYFQEQIP